MAVVRGLRPPKPIPYMSAKTYAMATLSKRAMTSIPVPCRNRKKAIIRVFGSRSAKYPDMN